MKGKEIKREHTVKGKSRAAALLLGVAALCSIAPATAQADEYWDRKTSLFEVLPVRSTDIVFLGNSITDGGEFTELFGMPNILNRGISSDVITGVEKRLTQVTAGQPARSSCSSASTT